MTGELKSGMPVASGTPNFYPMNDTFALQNFFGLAEVIANIRLRADPTDVAFDSLLQLDLWFVTGVADFCYVTGEMTHFAGAKFVAGFWLDADPETPRKNLRDFADRRSFAAADVHSHAVKFVGFSGEQVRARDIFDKGEVACLLAVFIKNRRQIVEQARAEDRDHAGVRVKDRLARAVGAGISKRDGWNSNLLSPKQHQSFLIDFGQTVNGFPTDRRVFRCRRALGDGAAHRAMHFPITSLQLCDRPHRWKHETMLGTTAGAFAVNRLRARHDNFLDRHFLLPNNLEHLRGAKRIHMYVF